MENEENQPASECNQTPGNGDEHEPTHHTERVKELAVIVSIDNARTLSSTLHPYAFAITAHNMTDPTEQRRKPR
jgi:hypothetical protein